VNRLAEDAEIPLQPHSGTSPMATQDAINHLSPEELLEQLPNLSDDEVDALLKQITDSD
jgi:hypothetical protein